MYIYIIYIYTYIYVYNLHIYMYIHTYIQGGEHAAVVGDQAGVFRRRAAPPQVQGQHRGY